MKETKKTATAPEPQAPSMDWSQYGATGFENVTSDDLGLPFLVILQSKSPEVDESSAEYETYKIVGAKAGTIINSLSKDILWNPRSEMPPVQFVPAYYRKLFVEWTPRNRGGGIVRSHSDPSILMETTRNDKNQDVLRNGNLIVTTGYFFGMYLTPEGPVKCVIGMSSTQLKKSKLWLNMATSLKVAGPGGSRITPPLFSCKYNLTSIPESNEKGSWMGWKIESAGFIQTRELLDQASEFCKQIQVNQQRLLLAGPGVQKHDDEIPV